ncbi:PREDICTED: photosynthetic NDH subunit of lumenal location 1, chloroplastic [Nicotiana attenuata]|uniref:Photosynthetic ndh subunit of lumenal location 1, chloroplastic n=1 Tax=Nicotiana attenuata TaxID=49451 RepID=A0A1J6I0B1_NICAT|nr:PREDICTED: photosynthetic NDH subunit of lumenal location 1, chloroplastic [Nicotiana attenuata]OIS98525.1 photosynthetic ndh subunit of lumenal location 1, chloroplastic [Nicotiana attenuata]
MAATSLSLSLPSAAITNRVSAEANAMNRHANIIACSASENTFSHQERSGMRRAFLLGVGALLLPTSPLLAQGKPENYEIFVDKQDGYSYYYPSDWREFDFRGHDSAFKDRYLQLQNVRLSFIPTDKSDIHDLGPMEEVVANLVKHVYSAPNQVANIMEMRERSTDGKNYCTFEYVLTSPNFSRAAFATIAIGNGRFYTLIVGANERRWRKFRNKLKVVADSFQVLDMI